MPGSIEQERNDVERVRLWLKRKQAQGEIAELEAEIAKVQAVLANLSDQLNLKNTTVAAMETPFSSTTDFENALSALSAADLYPLATSEKIAPAFDEMIRRFRANVSSTLGFDNISALRVDSNNRPYSFLLGSRVEEKTGEIDQSLFPFSSLHLDSKTPYVTLFSELRPASRFNFDWVGGFVTEESKEAFRKRIEILLAPIVQAPASP